MRICGQHFTSNILDRIGQVVAEDPDISRRSLSRNVCQWLNWRSSNGQWQEGSCRKALARLHREGVISLPGPAKTVPRRGKPTVEVEAAKVDCTLEELGPVELILIEDHRSGQARTWRGLMDRYHYLGDARLPGAQLRYLIHSPRHGLLGGLAFNSGCWALADRDAFIGWSEAARRHNLQKVVCNSRFLIVPGVRVPNLASHLLARAAERLVVDWAQRYGQQPVLLESFVDPSRFDGSCYRGANWIEVGTTSGRRDGVAKTLFVYPLADRWRQTLQTAPPRVLGACPRPPAPAHWAEQEFGTLPVYDERLKNRLFLLAQDFYNDPEANIPEACGSRARTMGAYRFLQNPKITMDVILTPHVEATVERINEHKVVLAPQDTTMLNYSHHPATEGLGPVNTESDKNVGLMLHDTLAFSTDGVPLGVLDGQCWARDPAQQGKSEHRGQLPIEQKESMKWLRSYRRLAEIQRLCPQTMLVSIGDRESDVYDLFDEATRTPDGPKLLIRAERSRKRRLVPPELRSLWEFMESQPKAGILELQIPKRGSRAGRQAQLEVRFSPVKLRPPANSRFAPVHVWAVHLHETHPSDDGEPIEWMLLTTVAVTDYEQAVQRAEWYAARWGIEVYHRTLKSGCRIKNRQLGTAKRLQACLGIDMVVAWRIYHLTMLGRQVPDHPCSVFFEQVEWKALYCYRHQTHLAPDTPPSLAEAIQWLGGIGGHLGRTGDGPPGTQVLWRGLQKLDVAIQMYITFTKANQPNSWHSYPDGYLPSGEPP